MLGEGSYGTVYNAIDKTTKKQVAIKITKHDYSIGYEPDVLHEFAYSLAMNHPNIIKYSVIVSQDNSYWKNFKTFNGMVMDKADGSLESLIEDNFEKNNKNYGSISSNYINMAYQLIDAGVYMSNHNIIHRDLKPGNIIYNKCNKTNNYHLRVIDFGSAINGECYKDKIDPVAYTLPYRPPEIVMVNEQDVKYNSKADVWAMGCILYEMAVGRTLFFPLESYDKIFDIALTDNEKLAFNIIGKLGRPMPNSDFYDKYNALLKWLRDLLNQHYDLDIIIGKINPENLSVIDEIQDKQLVDLLKKMLNIDPKTRISMKEAQKHPIFSKLAINKPVDNCYKLIDSMEIKCKSRSEIFDRNLLFDNIDRKFDRTQLLSTILYPWMLEVFYEFHSQNIFQVYFAAIQMVLRYTNELKQDDATFKKYIQMYGSVAIHISSIAYDNYHVLIDDISYITAKRHSEEEIFHNEHDMLRKLNFDLLASTPYDVIAGYVNIIDDSIKDIALGLLAITSFNILYYEPVNNKGKYKYKEELPIHCIITANIMLENSVPSFSKSLNFELCNEIVGLCDKYVKNDDESLYLTTKLLTKELLQQYIVNYNNFMKQNNHGSVIGRNNRGLVIGRNNKVDNNMIELMDGINLSYYNTSDDESLLSGTIPKEVLDSLDKNYDIVIIDGKDVAMKETIKCGMKLLRSGGTLYSEYLLFSIVESYNKTKTYISKLKTEINSLVSRKNQLFKERKANHVMLMNRHIDKIEHDLKNAEFNRLIKNFTKRINSVRYEIKNIDDAKTINSINGIMDDTELQSYIFNYLNKLNKQYGYKPDQYKSVYKYIAVIKK